MKRSRNSVWRIVAIFSLLFIIRLFTYPPAASGALTDTLTPAEEYFNVSSG